MKLRILLAALAISIISLGANAQYAVAKPSRTPMSFEKASNFDKAKKIEHRKHHRHGKHHHGKRHNHRHDKAPVYRKK